MDAMARAATNDDALDLWTACARQVDDVLAARVASHALLVEVMSQYPETTAGSVVEARDLWYNKIMASGGGIALDHVLAVLDAVDELAHDAVNAIGDTQAHALERQAKVWAHARRTRLFWANVDVATLRIEATPVECESIRSAYTTMRNGTFGDVMATPSANHDAVFLLCDIIMDLDSVLGSADAMAAVGIAVERTCVPSDCSVVESTTE